MDDEVIPLVLLLAVLPAGAAEVAPLDVLAGCELFELLLHADATREAAAQVASSPENLNRLLFNDISSP
jgi:hypothetical protein